MQISKHLTADTNTYTHTCTDKEEKERERLALARHTMTDALICINKTANLQKTTNCKLLFLKQFKVLVTRGVMNTKRLVDGYSFDALGISFAIKISIRGKYRVRFKGQRSYLNQGTKINNT